MSESWKCCKNCQCPCKNNDICPDTPAHSLSKIRESTPEPSDKESERSSPSSRSLPSSPTMDDLLELERKIEQKLKNMPKLSDQSLHDSTSPSPMSSLSHRSTDSSPPPTEAELYLNEIHILRLRLQEAELRNAIIEEKVNRLEDSRKNHGISRDRIDQIKRQIIEFIELKFSQISDSNK